MHYCIVFASVDAGEQHRLLSRETRDSLQLHYLCSGLGYRGLEAVSQWHVVAAERISDVPSTSSKSRVSQS